MAVQATELVGRLLEGDSLKGFFKDQRRRFTVKYLVFPVGNRAYGGGGWSRNARHRPAPEIVEVKDAVVELKGRSVIVNGVRRLKCNVWDGLGKPIRIDYPDLSFVSRS